MTRKSERIVENKESTSEAGAIGQVPFGYLKVRFSIVPV
ncbi:hypothetical protein Enr13x_73770 [Stieleria neptunia]|uniref:Uncharacterized protein n=1 Tax=Stieleria neptunia TaxID=2527979 RepID=A0A518I304_9BACT|nr:hypothetical protein Enr13x_73770 [Stieleria neptunia]